MQPPDGARNVARFRQNEFGSLVFGTTVFGTLARPDFVTVTFLGDPFRLHWIPIDGAQLNVYLYA